KRKDSTHCRTGISGIIRSTRCAAAILWPPHDGQTERDLHENGSRRLRCTLRTEASKSRIPKFHIPNRTGIRFLQTSARADVVPVGGQEKSPVLRRRRNTE